VQGIHKSNKRGNNNIIIIKKNHVIAMKFQNQLFIVEQNNYTKYSEKNSVTRKYKGKI
jgi:hypothetical protein